MKLEVPENSNYAAEIVRIRAIDTLEGLDKLVAVNVFGSQALVSKDEFQVGDLAVYFPTEVQLDAEFCRENGLFRHPELNKDPAKTGYLEDNRRVRAIKFRKQRSDCFVLPLECLAYAVSPQDLKEHDVFDKIGTHAICKKYEVKRKVSKQGTGAIKAPSRVSAADFPEHIDTDNYLRNKDNIPQDAWIVVTQKVHGSSLRASRIRVRRNLKLRERVAKRLGVAVNEHEYDYVFGSRRVIKDPNNPNQAHFYDSDVWTAAGRKIADAIPTNFVVYGELLGWVDGGEGQTDNAIEPSWRMYSPIQKNYTYQIPEGQQRLLVYRVTVMTPDGIQVDLSYPQMWTWCQQNGLETVKLLWSGFHFDFKVDRFLDIRFADAGYGATNDPPLPLESGTKETNKLVDEGVVIRWDAGLKPLLYKQKSPIFLAKETEMLDADVVDLETVGSESDGQIPDN